MWFLDEIPGEGSQVSKWKTDREVINPGPRFPLSV